LGHAVIGKYSEIGWVFSVAEPVFAGLDLSF